MGHSAVKIPMTAEEFIAWDEHETLRREFVRGEVFAMACERALHDFDEEHLFSAGDVVIKRSVVEPDGGGDVAQRDGFVAAGVKKLFGGVEHAGFGVTDGFFVHGGRSGALMQYTDQHFGWFSEETLRRY